MCPHTSTTFPRPAMDIEVKLEPTSQAPGAARRFVTRELAALGYAELVEDARLIVSELTTNSITYAPGKPLWVDIRRAGKYVVLEVWDSSPHPPVTQDPDVMALGGRGLYVVDKLSIKWDYDIFCCGKVVWAMMGKNQSST